MTSTSSELSQPFDDIDIISFDIEQYKDIVDLRDVCRLCGIQFESCLMTPIFSNTSDNLELKINDIIPIELNVRDGLPQTLCTLCISKLNQAHDFIKRSVAFDDFLKNVLYQDVSKIDAPEESNEELIDVEFVEDFEQGNDASIVVPHPGHDNASKVGTEIERESKSASETTSDCQSIAAVEKTAKPPTNKRLRDRKSMQECPVCKTKFNSFSVYKIHVLKCSKRQRKPQKKLSEGAKEGDMKPEAEHKCYICKVGFPSSHELYNHRKLCLLKKCEVCGMLFRKTTAKILHTMFVHKAQHDLFPYKCPECSKEYTSRSRFMHHLNSYIASHPFQCHICGNHNHSADHLRIHLTEHDYFLPPRVGKAARLEIMDSNSYPELET